MKDREPIGAGTDSVQIVTDCYAKFTESERSIADYIVGHVSEVAYLSARELGKIANVSEATITRFCQTCGFDGFRQFKISIARGSASYDDYVVDLEESGEGLQHTVQRVGMASIRSIRSTLESLDYKALEAAAKRILSCKRLYFFGMGTSALVCQDATIKFIRLNKPTFSYVDPHVCASAFSLLGGSDVVVAISHSGATREVFDLMRIAKKNGAATIAVTTYPEAPIPQICDIVLKTMTRETPMHTVAITSRMSQLAMVDSLLMSVAFFDHPQTIGSLAKVSESIREYREGLLGGVDGE